MFVESLVAIIVRFPLIEKRAIRVDLHENAIADDDEWGPRLTSDFAGAIGRPKQGARDRLHIGVGQVRRAIIG